ncbi:MAG TPA: hypothetical protein PKD51_01795 [Saprospiraceae bacterium]|nr:hypothetical protein [Saprospiraceae bacterium]
MKKEILDFRFLVSVVLVISSLFGQAWIEESVDKTETQNHNFIIQQSDNENIICLESNT